MLNVIDMYLEFLQFWCVLLRGFRSLYFRTITRLFVRASTKPEKYLIVRSIECYCSYLKFLCPVI